MVTRTSTKMAISLTPDELRNLLAAAMQQAMISVPPTSVQTAPVPSFQNYEMGLEKWGGGAYMQRLNQHMITHAVGDQHKKKAYFLSWVGANTYELINKLFSASELDAASFDDVTGKLDEHFKQSVHELAASYTFYQCKMKPGQTYGDWVADLRCIGHDCNYGPSQVLDRLIRDMIVLNTPHKEVRRACLRESSPSLEMVLKIANSYVALAASDAIVKGPTQGPTYSGRYGTHSQLKKLTNRDVIESACCREASSTGSACCSKASSTATCQDKQLEEWKVTPVRVATRGTARTTVRRVWFDNSYSSCMPIPKIGMSQVRADRTHQISLSL